MTAYSSTQSGDWSVAATWGGGGVPGDGDTATINGSHVVEIDSSITVGTNPSNNTTMVVTVNNGGQLKWKDSPTGDWTFTIKGNVKINKGGTFSIGTSSNRIPSGRTADVYFPSITADGWRINNSGKFEVYGAQDYHCANEASQRSRFDSDKASDFGVNITTTEAVDWEVGDEIWLGHGAGRSSLSAVEKTTIDVKTDASNYTVDLGQDHYENDFIINGERNVTIRGKDSTYGVVLYCYTTSATDADDIIINLDWCKLKYFGTDTDGSRAVLYFYAVVGTAPGYHIPAGNFSIKNTLIDECSNVDARGIQIYTDLPFEDDGNPIIENVHMWQGGRGHRIESEGVTRINNTSFLGINYWGVWAVEGDVRVDGIWYCSRDYADSTSRIGVGGCPTEIKNFYCYSGKYLFNPLDGYCERYVKGKSFLVENGVINYSYSYGILLQSNNYPKGTIRNVEFTTQRVNGIYLYQNGDVFIEDCTFDNCNTVDDSTYGAITVLGTTDSIYPGGITIRNCSFGMTYGQNYRFNVVLRGDAISDCEGRVIVKDSTFREPINWAYYGSYRYCSKAVWWMVTHDYMTSFPYRFEMAAKRTIEFARCQSIEHSSSTDIFPTTYPGVTHLAIVHGGGEIRNQSTYTIDETLPMLILPFHTVNPCWATYVAPVKIPVAKDETLTVKLSLRKNKDNDRVLPSILLRGPGFFDEDFMSVGVVDSWEELTVSGMAVEDGVAEFWVSGGTNNVTSRWADRFKGNNPPSLGAGEMSDVAFDVKVYTDGLDITKS